MRKRIFEIIEVAQPHDKLSQIYDRLILILVILSIIPLDNGVSGPFSELIDNLTACMLILDYFLRWITVDYKHPNQGKLAFVFYPITLYAVVDLLSILPTILPLAFALHLPLRWRRLLRLSRLFLALKLVRYSKNLDLFISILKKNQRSLLSVCYLALEYIFLSALIIFCVEPESFETFFDAVYWAVVTLTTVGYGDIYPVTTVGRVISMISSFVGIAIIALPTGIITVGYREELEQRGKRKKRNQDIGDTLQDEIENSTKPED